MYINGSLFSSLTEPSSRSLSSSERCSRPLVIPVPSARSSPCLPCAEQPRTGHSLPPVPPHQATRRPAAAPSLSHPAAAPARAQSPRRRRLPAGEQQENPRNSAGKSPGHARPRHSLSRAPPPPLPAPARTGAEPRRRARGEPASPPLMAAPQGLPPRPRPAGSAPKLGVCSSVSLSEKCSGSRTRCKFSLPVNLVKFPGGKGVVNSQQGCGQCGCVKLGRVG